MNLILSSLERDEVVDEILKLLADLRIKLDSGVVSLAKFEILKVSFCVFFLFLKLKLLF